MSDAERKALVVVCVPGQTRKQLDEAVPDLGGEMCTGGRGRCRKVLFPGHKDERNGKQLTRCNTCRGKPPDGAKQTSAASPIGALAGANAMIGITKEVDVAEDKLINHFAQRYKY